MRSLSSVGASLSGLSAGTFSFVPARLACGCASPGYCGAAALSSHCYRDAGGGTGDAVDDADGVGDEAADGVEGLTVHHRDEVVGPGDRVHRRDGGARALDLGEG